jgi:hypothetical protein
VAGAGVENLVGAPANDQHKGRGDDFPEPLENGIDEPSGIVYHAAVGIEAAFADPGDVEQPSDRLVPVARRLPAWYQGG